MIWKKELWNFQKRLSIFIKYIKEDKMPFNICDQLLRSATSIGANYREANDAFGNKDFFHKVRISRKEAKEVIYWLEIINHYDSKYAEKGKILIKECTELKNILSSIIKNKIKFYLDYLLFVSFTYGYTSNNFRCGGF